ncbi:unnamed protein product [Alopecurus aequalis]
MESVRMPITIIYEEVVEDREQFLHRGLSTWAHGRMPWTWSDEPVQRSREEEHRQQSHRDEEVEWFNLKETTWAAAGSRLQTECAVCLKDFEAEDKVSTMPCNHCFHQGCISEWLQVSCVCPLCRGALPTA